ncbi:MAG: winged helix-turn-helix transcriptional regulator, partial [Parabacteroides sp.]|nr:winged helix-turn-helix transcriptional regulator [Parabacteroides sp.]
RNLEKIRGRRTGNTQGLPGDPPKVEYNLTARADTLIPLLSSLFHWAIDNMEDIIKDRMNYLEKIK